MIPTKEEYEKALLIVNAYESEIKNQKKLCANNAISELKSYFKSLNNDIKEISFISYYDSLYIMAYDENGNEYYDEDYDGEYDEDIEKVSKKYNIYISMDSSQYGK
ncbi:hypothetical protein M0Q50_09840 [bacterium]|jgi:hypothetical protein|nr:hypothetical protein [bacterium]